MVLNRDRALRKSIMIRTRGGVFRDSNVWYLVNAFVLSSISLRVAGDVISISSSRLICSESFYCFIFFRKKKKKKSQVHLCNCVWFRGSFAETWQGSPLYGLDYKQKWKICIFNRICRIQWRDPRDSKLYIANTLNVCTYLLIEVSIHSSKNKFKRNFSLPYCVALLIFQNLSFLTWLYAKLPFCER